MEALPVLASRGMRARVAVNSNGMHLESEGIFPSEVWSLFEPARDSVGLSLYRLSGKIRQGHAHSRACTCTLGFQYDSQKKNISPTLYVRQKKNISPVWQTKEEYQPYMSASVCHPIFFPPKSSPINTWCVNNTHARIIFSRPRNIFVSIRSQWPLIFHLHL